MAAHRRGDGDRRRATAGGCGPSNAASDRGGWDVARGARRRCQAGERRGAMVGAAQHAGRGRERRGESEARCRDARRVVPIAA
jgi:hypothetical protein